MVTHHSSGHIALNLTGRSSMSGIDFKFKFTHSTYKVLYCITSSRAVCESSGMVVQKTEAKDG